MRYMRGMAIGTIALGLAWATPHLPAQGGAPDTQLQAEVQKALGNKRLGGVQVQAASGVVTLGGEVALLADKIEAGKKAAHQKGVTGVENRIQVHVPENADDAALFQKLAKGLTYDRVGYGTTAFNAISIEVHNGVVAVSGVVYGPVDKSSALSLIANTRGVRDMIDKLEVAPTSPNDDRIRLAEQQVIYGQPALNRYALDPAKPIRITVINGHVTLSGSVNSTGDRNIAGIQANTVSGVFSVQNNLQVTGQASER